MLKALQEQLRLLADNSMDQFGREISKRIDSKATEEQIQTLKDFVFLMPPTLKVLSRYWNDKNTPHQAKTLAGLIITYVYHPNDLISDDEHGLFGYLDDSYLVVASFLKIQEIVLTNWDDKSELERDLEGRAKKLINAPQIVIPEATDQIDKVIKDWFEGKIDDIMDNLNKN